MPTRRKEGRVLYSPFIQNTEFAVITADLPLFEQVLGPEEKPAYAAQELQALFSYQNSFKNNIFHLLLDEQGDWFLIAAEKRRARAEMFARLLNLPGVDKALNQRNELGLTPLHIAIQKGYSELVDEMVDKADITITTSDQASCLDLAAKYNRPIIYKKLLQKHTALNKNQVGGFTTRQLESAANLVKANMNKKLTWMGIFGSILAIACPVGAVMAFSELPLLAFTLGILVGTAGPMIGLLGAVGIGGLLFWSMYHKATMKYGDYAQKIVDLNTKTATITRLKAELNEVNQLLGQENVPKGTSFRRQQIMYELHKVYQTVGEIKPRNELLATDWTTPQDTLRTYMLTFGSFFCSFSGVLGVTGGLAAFVPGMVATSAVLAGIPVVGWAALAVALVIGVGVAAWAYHAKFKPMLEQCGRARRDLHEKELALWDNRKQFEKELAQKPISALNHQEKVVHDSGMWLKAKNFRQADSDAQAMRQLGVHQQKPYNPFATALPPQSTLEVKN